MLFARIIGYIIAVMIVLALSNFFLKQISRDYVKKLPPDYKDFADAYRRFMQRIVRTHRFFGLGALLLFPVHAGINIFYGTGSLTGIIAGSFLCAVVLLGLYGYYINRNFRAWWLSVHRTCAFVLLISVLVHIFYKSYIFF